MSQCTPSCIRGTKGGHCKTCHQSFGGDQAFDRHRTGKHGVSTGPDRRRCRTISEMLELGMVLNKWGAWGNKPPKYPYWESIKEKQ